MYKLKTVFILMFLVPTFNLYADGPASKFCNNKSARNPTYDIFYKSKTMKHKFSSLYKTVDSELENYFLKACKENRPLHIMINEAEDVCIKTCDVNSDSYTDGKFFGKKEMGKEIFNECATICNAMRYTHDGYIQGSADAGKKDHPSDCTGAIDTSRRDNPKANMFDGALEKERSFSSPK